MFTVKDVMAVCRFMENLKNKGILVVLEFGDDLPSVPRLRVEFEEDNYDMVTQICKDWILFHSSLVKCYDIAFGCSLFGGYDGQYWFVIDLKERKND